MTLMIPFPDRIHAGEALAERLAQEGDWTDALVLALPRGGVPVAFEVAQRLGLELDILVVRKLGTPGNRELAMGAIASGGVRVMNEDIVRYVHASRPRSTAPSLRRATSCSAANRLIAVTARGRWSPGVR